MLTWNEIQVDQIVENIKTHKKQALFILGPTASGKSSLALALAKIMNGVIINTDSMQVYADLSIITARPQASETQQYPHFLYGHIAGNIAYSVGAWLDDVACHFHENKFANKFPIFVGGTGLYFKSLTNGLADIPHVSKDIENKIEDLAQNESISNLHHRLLDVDPMIAHQINPNDKQRILRALMVYESTGFPLSYWQNQPHSQPLFNSEYVETFLLMPERQLLYNTINKRFDEMIQKGGLEEVERLMKKNIPHDLPVMKAIGVPQLISYLKGEIKLEIAIANAKTASRRYAKRQITWFRHQM